MFEIQKVEENYWGKVNEIIRADETKFEVDQSILWTREYKGVKTVKPGHIRGVIAPGRIPNKDLFPSLFSYKNVGQPRKKYSYVVEFLDGEIAWPLAIYLSENTEGVTEETRTPIEGFDPPESEETEIKSEVEKLNSLATTEPIRESDGKTLVEVFSEEEASRIAKGVTEAYAGEHPDIPETEKKESEEEWKAEIHRTQELDKVGYDLEDVETQVERELEEVITQEPPWNNPSSRMFMHQDGHDGDGHDIKTDSDPDRELGTHIRGAIRIMSEAFFGKRSNVTQEKLKEWQRNDDELWKKIRHLEEQLSHRNADVERLQERVKKEMSFQTETSTQADESVYKLRKEIEVLCQENEALTRSVSKLVDERGSLSDNVEYWKSRLEESEVKKDKLQDDLNLLRGGEVTPETSDIFSLKEQIDGYKSVVKELHNQIENLENHAERREEQIVLELEKIEKLEAEVKDFKTKNEILPDEAVKHLRSEVVRLQGELDTAKTTIEHYKNQAVKPKAGRKVESDKETVMEAFRWAMDRTARAWSSNENYTHTDRQFEVSYQQWMEGQK